MNKSNNFDFLRLIFASFVIISHSYPLTGIKECDWLCQLSSNQISFSYLGVRGFFIISGYLIFQSLERSKNLVDYYWKRFLRLFPALFIVLILTIILAPFVYESKHINFLSNKDVWTYIPNNLCLYRIQYTIKGVFENNPYPSVINGSLWTIPYEFTMYLLLSLFYFIRKKNIIVKLLFISFYAILLFVNIFFINQMHIYTYFISTYYLFDLGLFFIAGSLLASINICKFRFANILAIMSLIITIVSFELNGFYIVKYFVLPFLVIYFGLKSTPIIKDVGKKIGDLSYGIYIYAFPVQQTLVYFFHLNYIELVLSSFLITLFLASLSWHLIEFKALKLKNKHPLNYIKIDVFNK